MGRFLTALLSLVLQVEGSSRYVCTSNQLSDGLIDYFNPIITVIFNPESTKVYIDNREGNNFPF